jgi:hypothetical protein
LISSLNQGPASGALLFPAPLREWAWNMEESVLRIRKSPAWLQSGYAAACKAAYAGSIPTQASKFKAEARPEGRAFCFWSFA